MLRDFLMSYKYYLVMWANYVIFCYYLSYPMWLRVNLGYGNTLSYFRSKIVSALLLLSKEFQAIAFL